MIMRFMKVAALLVLMPVAAAAQINQTKIDQAKIDEATATFEAIIKDNKLAQISQLVAKDGEIQFVNVFGHRSVDRKEAVKQDDIFRIYSMTKPIVGAALMMLYEEGKFKLDDPVSAYIPAFKNQRVFVGLNDDGSMKTVPVEREATIRDLMRHTSGLTYGWFTNTPVDIAYRKSGAFDPQNDIGAATKILAKIPLLYQPGRRWVYSLSVDVQGYLIEVLSGQKLDVFLKDRLFTPLGMVDTDFYVPSDKIHRLVDMTYLTEDGTLTSTQPKGSLGVQDFTVKPALLSGGGGLVSTLMDYFYFAQMLANGGTFNGKRYLQPATIQLMAQNHLPEGVVSVWGRPNLDFGLNFSVQKNDSAVGPAGVFQWSGMANTKFWIDPTNNIVSVQMTNILPSGAFPLRETLKEIIYSKDN